MECCRKNKEIFGNCVTTAFSVDIISHPQNSPVGEKRFARNVFTVPVKSTHFVNEVIEYSGVSAM